MAQTGKFEAGSDEVKEYASEAKQRHHDHYVRSEREGTLAEEESLNLELAERREREGVVKPLP
jgi:hypothetical protein